MKKLRMFLLLFVVGFIPLQTFAWPGMPTPALHVDGRYLKDPCGHTVLLHGVAMTPSPWFNGCAIGECRWDNYDVQGCLNYNYAVMDKLTDTQQGWYLNYVRLHIDPYWTNDPGSPIPESDISRFNFNRLVTYTDQVIVPLINHARERGMYVILRPPGVCPQQIEVNGAYHNYLKTVWQYLSQNPAIKNADNVMFELANEPIQIKGTNGVYGSNTQAHFDALKIFFQDIVNIIRGNGANNICWIPGSGWQSEYSGYANNPVTGNNIGYAVHIYPGYWGQDLNNPSAFQNGWNANIAPVANFAPIAITETDWGPEQYNVFGKGGITGNSSWGFGTKLKQLADQSGNVSWNVLSPENLIDRGDPNGGIAYNNDPDACANPCYTWFQQYASSNLPVASCGGGGGGGSGLQNNGVYEIEFQTNSNKVLDLRWGEDANGAMLRPWDRNGASAQRWKLVSTGDGYWRIISMASSSNRCIDLASGSTALDTEIRLWDYYSNDAQAWQISSTGNGYYSIKPKLAVAGGVNRGWDVTNCTMDGSEGLRLWDYYGTSCQKFKFNYITTSNSKVTVAENIRNTKALVSNVEFSVFPNPADGGNFKIVLQGARVQPYEVSIFTMDGKKVFVQDGLSEKENQLTPGLKRGVYFVRVSNSNHNFTRKLVVE